MIPHQAAPLYEPAGVPAGGAARAKANGPGALDGAAGPSGPAMLPAPLDGAPPAGEGAEEARRGGGGEPGAGAAAPDSAARASTAARGSAAACAAKMR